MKLLLDTNVFIPLEPTSLADLEPRSEISARLLAIASRAGATVYLHPIQRMDIGQDKNDDRRTLRLKLLEKYSLLPSPPVPNTALLQTIGIPKPGSNSEIDAHLIAALERDVIDVLVTEDQGIHKRCGRIGIANRCLTISQTIERLRDELPAEPSPPPAVRSLLAHELVETDPIFDSLRGDYDPQEFDKWLRKCRREHRQCWVINLLGRPHYAGVCIVNREDRHLQDAADPTLKICTFKIAEDVLGMKLGELLLRTVFEYAWKNDVSTLFVETYPKQMPLIHLLETFGFVRAGEKAGNAGEMELRKHLKPHPTISVNSPFDFQRWFGPYQVQLDGVNLFLVPIEPRFHSMLFPDLERQKRLTAGTESYGNSIRKAYLCNSVIKRLEPGDVLLFYKSKGSMRVTAMGVVEETLRTLDPVELARFASKRTVYEQRDINAKTLKGSALGILFRYVPLLKHSIALSAIMEAGFAKSHPQSITSLPQEANEWIRDQLK